MADQEILSQILSRMSNTVQTQINSIAKITNKAQNFSNNILQKAQEKFAEFIKTLTSKPKSKSDYWKICNIYFAKKFVVISLFTIGALVYIYVNLIVPNLEGKLWYAKFSINSKKAQQFSGKAKVYDVDGKFIYQGELSSGTPDGFGTQFNSNGNLLYKGNFSMGKYSGSGEIFDSFGKLVYSGNFSSNKYDGSGKMVNSFGKVIYSGNFEKGMKSGRGTEYDPKTGVKRYYGEFVNGKYEGKGITYNADGSLVTYEGNFKDGSYEGEGKKYQNGHLIYDGNFKSGRYSGKGILYSESSGNIIYSGEFEDDLYSGEGKLYDSYNFKISYEGEFKNGKKHGTGILYDKLGVPIFEGDFRDNDIDYMKHFGETIDEVTEKFGRYTSKMQSGNKKLIFYNSVDSVMIFEPDADGEYIFSKVLRGTKNEFMGMTSKSSAIERRNILGQPFSSTKYTANDYQKLAFSILKSNIDTNYLIPTDKYVFENYFIRFFFDSEKSKIQAIEIGKL